MWYVNKHYEFMLNKLGFSFILTMWYVNLRGLPNGVKDRIGFILTMWYVNYAITIGICSKLQKFYINYVICK